jgi:hypothetical protein
MSAASPGRNTSEGSRRMNAWAKVSISFLGWGLAVAVNAQVPPQPMVPFGDGMAALSSFDPARQVVLVGKTPVRLSPAASAYLQQQLAQQGRDYATPFTAKFNVAPDGAGQPVIDGIYVLPFGRR